MTPEKSSWEQQQKKLCDRLNRQRGELIADLRGNGNGRINTPVY